MAIQLLPKALKSCPKSNKSPNLVTLCLTDVSKVSTNLSCPLVNSFLFLKKNGPIPASFPVFIFVFSTRYNLNWKKRRWCAWESNPGQQDGRHERIHWATAAPPCIKFFNRLLLKVQKRNVLLSQMLVYNRDFKRHFCVSSNWFKQKEKVTQTIVQMKRQCFNKIPKLKSHCTPNSKSLR